MTEVAFEKLTVKPGDIIIFRSTNTSAESVARFTARLNHLFREAEKPVTVIRMRPDQDLTKITEEQFARIAHQRGFYKAEPGH